MKAIFRTIAVAALLGGTTGMAMAQDGLLGGLLGGGGGSSGGGGGGLLSIDSGRAGGDALVGIGLGNDRRSPRNIADVNLLNGGDEPLANVRITGGNGQGGLLNSGGLLGTGLLDGDDDGGLAGSGILGSDLAVGINLAGLDLDLTVPGLDGLPGGDGGSGGPDGPGGPGGNGGGGGGVFVGGAGGANCSLEEGRQVLQLASQVRVNVRAWQRAAAVQVVPVRLCPAARAQVAQILGASGKVQALQQHAAADALIAATLDRTRHDARDVFAVEQDGGRLLVYVF